MLHPNLNDNEMAAHRKLRAAFIRGLHYCLSGPTYQQVRPKPYDGNPIP